MIALLIVTAAAVAAVVGIVAYIARLDLHTCPDCHRPAGSHPVHVCNNEAFHPPP